MDLVKAFHFADKVISFNLCTQGGSATVVLVLVVVFSFGVAVVQGVEEVDSVVTTHLVQVVSVKI